ncbi:MAG: hypothetical protein FJ011_01645 [Chloroflexi bacterium]|nr:hypothetical protein [Chloroflexota bacterium]
MAMIALLIAAQSAGALPLGRPLAAPTAASTGTIAYQGRLADAAGAPLTGTYNMIFRLYDTAAGGAPLWEEQWTGSNGVKVSDGLFNVMMGSLTPLPISQFTNYQSLFLGITVGTDDEMAPRVQLGSVPFVVQALTVSDGSITTAKIADGAVTQAKLLLNSGLEMSGDLEVSGNLMLVPGSKRILFSDPGNYDFSIVHNGGSSLDFRLPEYPGGEVTALRIQNGGGVSVPTGDLYVHGEIDSSTNVLLRYATVTTDGDGRASIGAYLTVLKPAHFWMQCISSEQYWNADYDFNYNPTIGQLSGLYPNCKVVVYYVNAPSGQGNPASSPPNW